MFLFYAFLLIQRFIIFLGKRNEKTASSDNERAGVYCFISVLLPSFSVWPSLNYEYHSCIESNDRPIMQRGIIHLEKGYHFRRQ